jgi:anthranilate phosphoribosyltransferase
MLKPYIATLMKRQSLSEDEAKAAMDVIMSGQATQAQIGSYLTALAMKGETTEEIAGSVRSMRAHANAANVGLEGMVDTAGTGGDGAHSFNISTAAAFVIAGAGVPVAKHGNRAASSQCGSADVLAALGVNLNLGPEDAARCVREAGIGFFFAPNFHPAMKHAAGPRRELGQRTIFNLLGPLSNPAGARRQLVGVYDPALTQPIADALSALGAEAAMVVHGHGGVDELMTGGMNQVSHLRGGRVTSYFVNPADFGLRPAGKEEVRGGDAGRNAEILHGILDGKDRGPRLDVVLLNAAAALALDDGDFAKGLEKARASVGSGEALKRLDSLVALSSRLGA